MKTIQINLIALISGIVTCYGSTTVVDFGYTGSEQTFVVPTGVNLITIETWGAQGWSYSGSFQGGLGGYSVGNLTVASADTLYLYVGGVGTVVTTINVAMGGGFNGGGDGSIWNAAYSHAGGGGGASDVRVGANGLANRVIVAGGGGGSTGNGSIGGSGGGLVGGTASGSNPGTGGTQVAGGSIGGSFGLGGSGLTDGTQGWVGGGGGGWYGGGASPAHYGGGGGSSFIGGVSDGSVAQGVNLGDGAIRLTYDVVPEPSALILILVSATAIGFRRHRG